MLGQLTRAGEALHVSQPAITAQIKALEEDLQVKLFERTPTGMVLTKPGQQLLVQAEKVLSAAQELKNQAKALSGEVVGKISLGTVTDPDFIRLGDFLNGMVEQFPMVEIELHQRVSGKALEDVRDGTLQASFYFGELAHPGVTGLALSDIVYCVAAPAAWRDRVEHANWEQIAALPWVLAPSFSTHSHLLQELFRNQGAEPSKVVEADQESLLNNLVISGVGLSLMREDQALTSQQNGDVIIWGDARLTTTLWFIYPDEQRHDPVISGMIDVLRSAWQIKLKRELAI